jgi:hypothetical protein
MKLLRELVIGALLAAAVAILPAGAHDPIPRHGGTVVTTATYHVELVAKDGQIDVYLMNHADKPVPATGRKGVAILLIEGKSVRVPLEPMDGERLSGKAAVALPRAPKGVVQITEPTGGPVQARFN